jgi:putative Holliday junction resolvase
VAVADRAGITAQPHSVIDRIKDDAGEVIADLVVELEIGLLVIGLPVHLSGAEGASARAARAFGADLAETTGLPVAFYNEQFSSVVAERALLEGDVKRTRRRDVRDKVAAAIILQGYLDAQR